MDIIHNSNLPMVALTNKPGIKEGGGSKLEFKLESNGVSIIYI